MKKRNGFVSNSSSSSFIIAVAAIPGCEVEAFENKVKEKNFDIDVYTHAELMESRSRWNSHITSDGDRVYQSSFTYDEVDIRGVLEMVKNDPDMKFALLSESGYEPEYDDDSGEYNYDDVSIDPEWFDDRTLDALDLMCEQTKHEYAYGGGYNG